jgi:hypothetical protein
MKIIEIIRVVPSGASHYRVKENNDIMYYAFRLNNLSIISRRFGLIQSAFNVMDSSIVSINHWII